MNDEELIDPEYDPIPTGNEEDGWDYGDASPDDDLDNADWPKRTPDTEDALDEAIAKKPSPTPFISDGKWYAWFDLDLMDWDADSPDAPTSMIREEFHKEVMDAYIEADKTRWELYADVVSFLAKWGIKAKVVS